MAQRPEVLDVGAPAPSVCNLVENERRRRESAYEGNAPVNHLYPPDKGWVRLDPASQFDIVSLTDLAVLVNDPSDVATILLRLTDDDGGAAGTGGTALEQKFTDITTLFSSLDPRLARVMFGKLARAVLELDPERRAALLQKTILPGLLDGRADGNVLRDFPDVDLAESLCLLLELETAAPEVLTAALNRLDLPAERRETVVPLIDEKLRARQSASERADDAGLDRHARQLDQGQGRAGQGLHRVRRVRSVDGRTGGERARRRPRRRFAPPTCPSPNCSACGASCGSSRTSPRSRRFSRSRWRFSPSSKAPRAGATSRPQAASYRQLAGELRERRPDVADAIDHAMAAFFTADRALAIATLHDSGWRRTGQRGGAHRGVRPGGGARRAWDCSTIRRGSRRNRSLATLMCAHAALLAPALVQELPHCGLAARRVGVKVLGFAGAGYETAVADQVEHGDEPLVREALRALARMGTAHAASVVTKQLQNGNARGRAAAEEALWHFPPARVAAFVRELLGNHEFVLQHPATVTHVLDRAAKAGIEGLDPVLAELEPLRFRFWNPSLVRVAMKAREMRAR